METDTTKEKQEMARGDWAIGLLTGLARLDYTRCISECGAKEGRFAATAQKFEINDRFDKFEINDK